MRISIIVAMSRNRVIGNAGQIPWRLSNDLKRFKRLTMGSPILMGRKTHESIGRPLPGRLNIVLTRQRIDLPGVRVEHDLDEALTRLRDAGEHETFIIGGGEIYQLALPLTDRIYLTRIHRDIAGDALFPTIDESQWEEIESESFDTPLPYHNITLTRRPPTSRV